MAQEICLSSDFWHQYFKANNVTPASEKYNNVNAWIKKYKYEKFHQFHNSLLTIHSTFIALMPINYVQKHLEILQEAQISFKSIDYYMSYGKLIEYMNLIRPSKQMIKFNGSYNIYKNGLCKISIFDKILMHFRHMLRFLRQYMRK